MQAETPALSAGLLDQARLLATIDPRRPRLANLRRAVSSLYYAMFHFLVDQSVRLLIAGRGPGRERLRDVLARTYEHRRMRVAALAFAGRGQDAWAPRGAAVPDDLAEFARLFADLQEGRHRADYGRECELGRETVLDHIRSAQAVFDTWPSIRRHPATDAFLVALLIKPRS